MTTRPGHRLSIRRLPDGRGRLRRKPHHEVARFEAGSDLPVWVRATGHPGKVVQRR